VQSHDRQDASGGQGSEGEERCREVRADGFRNLPCGAAQLIFSLPTVEQRDSSDENHCKGQRDEQHPKPEMRAGGIPIDDALSGARGFILQRLQVAHEQRNHDAGKTSMTSVAASRGLVVFMRHFILQSDEALQYKVWLCGWSRPQG
jgi:hypothetical protein